MPELLHPGVYTLEVSSGVRPIEGVSTSTAAFIGVADKGPIPGTILPTGRSAHPPARCQLSQPLKVNGETIFGLPLTTALTATRPIISNCWSCKARRFR